MIWFTADEHFGHKNIITFCKRPFAHVDEMRDTLISNFNSVVGKNDETWHVGDFAWRHVTPRECYTILQHLNGKHHFVEGNHDETAKKMQDEFGDRRIWDSGFDSWSQYEFVKRPGFFPNVFCNHYAQRVWPDSHKGSYHAYGHTHNVLPDWRRSHDVGVDANNYFPVSYAQLDALMKSKNVPKDEVERDMEQNKWNKSGN